MGPVIYKEGKMKKPFIWVMLLAAAAWGPSKVLRAQGQPPAGGNSQPTTGQGAQPGMGGGMMGGGMLERLKENLGLTDDQVSKLKDLLKGQQEATRALRDQVRVDMDTLQQKVDAKAADGDLRKVLDALETDQRNIQAAQQKTEDGIRSILTPLQLARFVLSSRGTAMRGIWLRAPGGADGQGDNAGPGHSGQGAGPGSPPPASDGNGDGNNI